MKLSKLSLAAFIAVSAISSASAIPLEQAIKDVDVSGFAFYRYDTSTTDTDAKIDANDKKSNKSWHRWKSDVNFKAAFDDNFFGILGFRYDNRDVSGSHTDKDGDRNAGTSGVKSGANGFDGFSTNSEFNVRQILLGYTAGNTTIQAGRQVLGTFFTNDMTGTGIKILNTDVKGLTLAAIAFDDLENDAHIQTSRGKALGTSVTGATVTTLNNGSATYQNNLYGVAAIGSFDPVAFQAWYAYLENITSLWALDAKLSFDVGAKLGIQGQLVGSAIDGEFKDNIRTNLGANKDAVDNALFWALKASVEFGGFDFNAGYLDFSTDKDKLSLVNFEYNGGLICPGEEILDQEYTFFGGENHYWFVSAGYKFYENKIRISADYIDGENKNNVLKTDIAKMDRSEIVGRIAYQYSKKLSFLTWYSHIEEEVKNGTQTDIDHLRFQARYKF